MGVGAAEESVLAVFCSQKHDFNEAELLDLLAGIRLLYLAVSFLLFIHPVAPFAAGSASSVLAIPMWAGIQ